MYNVCVITLAANMCGIYMGRTCPSSLLFRIKPTSTSSTQHIFLMGLNTATCIG